MRLFYGLCELGMTRPRAKGVLEPPEHLPLPTPLCINSDFMTSLVPSPPQLLHDCNVSTGCSMCRGFAQ